MLSPWLALLVALTSPAPGDDDPEAQYKKALSSCKDDGEGAVRSARHRLEMRRPRLLPSLPRMDIERYCDCKFAARRSTFGLDTALQLELSWDLSARMGPEAYVRLVDRDQSLALDCIEQASTGVPPDPLEAGFADLIDLCQHEDVQWFTARAAVLLRMKPEDVKMRVGRLDRDQLCGCFYGSQRQEFGLEDTVRFNSLSGMNAPVDRAKAMKIQDRKSELFRGCVAGAGSGSLPSGGLRPTPGGPDPALPAPATLARRGRKVAVALALAGLFILGGLYYWKSRNRRRPPPRRPYRPPSGGRR